MHFKEINSNFTLKPVFDAILAKIGGGYIAGGAIRCVFDGTALRDVDVYFNCEQEYLDALEHLGVSSSGKNTIWRPSNLIPPVHLIGCCFGKPEQRVSQFDFVCTKGYYNGKLHVHDTLEFCVENKVLTFDLNRDGSPCIAYPFSTLMRLERYILKGYTISAEELRYLAVAIKKSSMQALSKSKNQYDEALECENET